MSYILFLNVTFYNNLITYFAVFFYKQIFLSRDFNINLLNYNVDQPLMIFLTR